MLPPLTLLVFNACPFLVQVPHREGVDSMTKKLLILLIVLAVGCLLVPVVANARPKADATYRLWHWEGSNWVRYLPSTPFPPGGANPGTNLWKYEYTVTNLAFTGRIGQFIAFFNWDLVLRSAYSTAVAPTNWTITYSGPAPPDYNWKVQFRTTVTSAKIAPGSSLPGFAVEFTWTDPTALPGFQHYDAIAEVSESDVTHDQDATPVEATTWGNIKALFSR